MRNSILIFVLLCLSIIPALARNIDTTDATVVATRFAYLHNIKGTPLLVKTIPSPQGHTPAVYIFSMTQSGTSQDEGFVAVAGSDCVSPIIAYSHHNSIEKHHTASTQPAPANQYLAMRAEEIAIVQSSNLPPSQEVTKQWNELLYTNGNTKRAQTKDEAPFLLTTTWDQSWPYNKYCPVINDNTAPVGCVATALSQILRYWSHPSQGQGSSSYMCGLCGERLTVDFSQTTYLFDSMPDRLFFYSPEAMVDATATLCYHAGISVWMQYTSVSSGVGMSNVGNYCSRALVNNFKYDTTVAYIYRATFSDELWTDTIRQEIEAGRPVLYCGYDNTSSGTDAGHAFVMDGYDPSTGFFHVNWGWGGGGDGWFDLYNKQLNVYNYRFVSMNIAIIGIQPAPEPEPMGISQSPDTPDSPLKVWPNPTSQILNIQYLPTDSHHVARLTIHSATGQLLTTETIRPSSQRVTKLDVSHYPAGIYFCTIDGHTTKFAIIK